MLALRFSLTGLMTSFVTVAMLIAWLHVTRRIRHNKLPPQRSVVFLNHYFLFIALFCACMSVPYIWLDDPRQFGLAMAIGYVVGHVFCYIAFMYITRMVFALLPRLANKDRVAVALWILPIILVTLVNAKTMIWGTRPVFDSVRGLTEFNAAPIVGASIVVLSVGSILPATILFARSALSEHGVERVKPLLLTIGFLTLMVAGPLHDIARTGAVYAAGDFLSFVSVAILCTGVMYRFEHRLDGVSVTAARRFAAAGRS